MVLSKVRSYFEDALEQTQDAIKSIEEATEGKDEEELKNEYEQEMERLVRQYNREVAKGICAHLDNQDWSAAEELARNEGNVDSEDWQTIVESYINHRLKRGLSKLKIIEVQLKQAEIKLENAESAEVLSEFEDFVKTALKGYQKIEQDEILEAQRDISRAENSFQHYGSEKVGKKLFRNEHKKANQLDRDVQKARKDLKELINKVKN